MTEVTYLQIDARAGTPTGGLFQPGPGAGDGVFETVRIHGGTPTLWAAHLQRMLRGLHCLGLDPGPAFSDEITDRTGACAASAGAGVVRIVVVAAPGAGYRRRDPPELLVSLQLRDAPRVAPAHYEAGVSAVICQQRLARQPALAGIKHLNRLEQILATHELAAAQADEGLMLDTGGFVIEGTRTNLFLRTAAGWITPDLADCGVRGTLRDALLETLPAGGVPVESAAVPATLLAEAEEMFVCNSVIGVWPVRELQGRPLTTGAGTRRAQELASALLAPGIR